MARALEARVRLLREGKMAKRATVKSQASGGRKRSQPRADADTDDAPRTQKTARAAKAASPSRKRPAKATAKTAPEKAATGSTGASSDGGTRGKVRAPSVKARSSKKSAASPVPPPAEQTLDPDAAAIIDDLRRELQAAHARIADLETRQSEVLDRINWVLDALKTATETTGRGRRRNE